MDGDLSLDAVMADDKRGIADVFARERGRLRTFIRRRVRDVADVDDILQDVFSELVEAEHAMRPVQQVAAWLFRVARNRITDTFRARKPAQSLESPPGESPDGEPEPSVLDLLPAGDTPEAAYARDVLLDELDAALDELPLEQRDVFVAHELEGISFKELAARSGVSINTLLGRKRYAVLHLRRRLQAIYEEFTES